MDGHEGLTDGAERAHRCGTAAHMGATAPLGRYGAGEQDQGLLGAIDRLAVHRTTGFLHERHSGVVRRHPHGGFR